MEVKKNLLRWLPLILLGAGLLLFFYFRLYTYLNFATLKQHRETLLLWTEQHYLLTVISFMIIYTLSVAISVPGALFLTLAGGFLFGPVYGTLFVVISATSGAIIIFLAMKTTLRTLIESHTGRFVKQMEQGFRENAFSYLMVLRLVPLFPFWVVNIVPALLGVPLRIFAITTFIGIIPGSLVYVSVGSGLGEVFASEQTPNLRIIFTPPILLPLLALAALSLIPLVYKRLTRKKT